MIFELFATGLLFWVIGESAFSVSAFLINIVLLVFTSNASMVQSKYPFRIIDASLFCTSHFWSDWFLGHFYSCQIRSLQTTWHFVWVFECVPFTLVNSLVKFSNLGPVCMYVCFPTIFVDSRQVAKWLMLILLCWMKFLWTLKYGSQLLAIRFRTISGAQTKCVPSFDLRCG